MRALAECLKSYMERYFTAAAARDQDGHIRPVIVGPPGEALAELFSLLTADAQHDWQVAPGLDVVVLHVGSEPTMIGNTLSQRCSWDYAVSIRNSQPRVLILATRGSWDNRPESLANTTETIGDVGLPSRAAEDVLQVHLVNEVANRFGLGITVARELMRLVQVESTKLEPAARDTMTWQVLDRLLSAAVSNQPVDDACRAVGLPVIGSSGLGFRDAHKVLTTLGVFVSSEGLAEAIDQMKATSAAQQHGVVQALESLHDHLSDQLISPTLLPTAPTRYYHVPVTTPSWYDALTASTLSEILTELNVAPRQDPLALACTNALPGVSPLRRGPFVVASSVELQASVSSGPTPGTPTFTRKIARTPPQDLPALPADPLRATDSAPPPHRKPIKYTVVAPNFRPGSVPVLSLDSFECGGLVVARDAERNGIPLHVARTGTWTQELLLTRGGTTEVIVYHASIVATVSLTPRTSPGQAQTCSVTPGASCTSATIEVEDSDEFTVSLLDASGTVVGEWTLVVSVSDDDTDVASSRLEGLVREHRTRRKCVPRAPDNVLHRLELGSYLKSPDSWKPVLACWTAGSDHRWTIDWTGAATLGNTMPQIDPRPAMTPPAGLLDAREAVRLALHQESRCVSEIEINSSDLVVAIQQYLQQYKGWLDSDPASACWLDVLALHLAEWNPQAGRHVATDEPVVALLSPLHPLRLAWHAVAQQQLSESLSHPCPGAGLLSPAQCPDSAALYLWNGNELRPRAFFSLPCDHPHWAVLANTAFLGSGDLRTEAMERLFELGLQVQAITGGFTSQQTQDSLREVDRLLPARATLRVGIVGEAETSSDCGEGVFSWSRTQHSETDANPVGSHYLEVFDTRGARDPTPEQLADLSEATAERVKWFKLPGNAQVPRLDLTIIDQLGSLSREAATGATRSALAPAALFRTRIREDFHEARSIHESRVAATRVAGTDLPSVLCTAVQRYEELTHADAGRTHFRFTPNQAAVGSRLQNAIFLSLTSSQIDPACIVRGTVGQQGFLWDYELPGVLGEGESSLGYYLVAKPNDAMLDAVERAASLVASPIPSVPGLLEEVSRHGIPILKRLASGGSQSRGELGLLLATRLLQDAFRPHAGPARLPVWRGRCIHFVLPVDPYEALFHKLRRALPRVPGNDQRPDLAVVAIRLPSDQQTSSIKITPVEIKYRGSPMPATEMRDALAQAQNLGRLMRALWVEAPASQLWETCARALLAQFLDFGFRIYAAQWLHNHEPREWADSHQTVMQDILEGRARVTVSEAGKLIVFDGSQSTRAADLDGDSRSDSIVVSQDDARSLLTNAAAVTPDADAAVAQLDFSFPDCGSPASAPAHSPADAHSTPSHVTATTPTASPEAVGAQAPVTPPPERPMDDHAGIEADSAAPAPRDRSRVPPDVRRRVRVAFEGFIGNEPAVARLSNDLLRALIEQPPHLAKNYLFTGLPSTGKTELARRMARALALPFVKLDGRGVTKRDKLFELVNGELSSHNLIASQVGQQMGLPVLEYPPLIVFIDEVHLVPRAVQEALLTMLEAADRTVALSDHVARVERATFLFATTRVSDVDAAFASRCDEIQLREYTEEEVAHILRWKLPQDDWPDEVFQAVARLGRCVPRIAIQLAEALETAILVSEEPKPVLDHLDDVRRTREIDDRGLTRMDFEYLSILERSGTPVGEQNILNLMRTVDKDRVLNDVEPFLVRLGFIQHGPRGRELTANGREYLLAHRAQGEGTT